MPQIGYGQYGSRSINTRQNRGLASSQFYNQRSAEVKAVTRFQVRRLWVLAAQLRQECALGPCRSAAPGMRFGSLPASLHSMSQVFEGWKAAAFFNVIVGVRVISRAVRSAMRDSFTGRRCRRGRGPRIGGLAWGNCFPLGLVVNRTAESRVVLKRCLFSKASWGLKWLTAGSAPRSSPWSLQPSGGLACLPEQNK